VRLLLDTHVFLWAAVDDERLPGAVRDLILDGGNRASLSVASSWELTIMVAGGRLRLPLDPAAYIESRTEMLSLDLLPIHQRHVAALPELPAVHADPFDRMLIAQALVEDLELVTSDQVMRRYPVRTLW
jgi:PIN domain nuclease of toxin-antitoxin system